MRRFYQFVIVAASTALAWIITLCIARSPLSPELATLFAGKNDSALSFLFYLGMAFGVLMTLGILGGLFAGVALARRGGKDNGPLELKAA